MKGVKRLLGDHRREALQVEHAVMLATSSSAAATRSRVPMYIDVLEGFAGAAHISYQADLHQLQAVEPADINRGWNLASRRGRLLWEWNIKEKKPSLTVMGFPCTPWCIFNRNVNYRDRPELLRSIQEADRPLLKIVLWTAKQQYYGDRWFLIENPPTSAAWHEPELQQILALPGVVTGIGHQCPYSFVNNIS